MDVTATVFRRINRYVRKFARWRARRWLERYEPRLKDCWEDFTRRTGNKVYAFHAERARLILSTLERYRPKLVLELGSGTSTAWFAAYARKHGAKFVCVDQHKAWLEAAVDSARRIGPVESVLAEVELIPGSGGRYAIDLPDADFVYVDGPWVDMAPAGGRRKGINLDVPRMLREGRSPAVIMIDGRERTIDYLREQRLVEGYDFFPEFIYCHARRDWLGALRFRRQSMFVRRAA